MLRQFQLGFLKVPSPGRILEYNIKMEFYEIGLQGVDLVHPAMGRTSGGLL